MQGGIVVVLIMESDIRLGKKWWENAKILFPDRAKFIDEVIKEIEKYEAVQELKELIVEGIKY